MDSRRLFERASHGDGEAVDELLVRFEPKLRAFIRLRAGALVLARESAADLAQSVCREVLENLAGYRWGGDAGFRHWMFAIARRKIADRYAYWSAAKRDVRREAPGEAPDMQAVVASYSAFATPSAHAQAEEAATEIEDAFQTLSDRQQDVIVLSRIFGLSHEEIAEHSGFPNAAAVRRTLHRGLSALSDAIVRRRARKKGP